VGELVGGGGDLRSDDVEHRDRIAERGWRMEGGKWLEPKQSDKQLAFYPFAGRKIREHFRFSFVRNVELK